MTSELVSKLGLKVCPTNVGVQKIDGSTLEMLGMVLASFQVEDMLGKTWFFTKNVLIGGS